MTTNLSSRPGVRKASISGVRWSSDSSKSSATRMSSASTVHARIATSPGTLDGEEHRAWPPQRPAGTVERESRHVRDPLRSVPLTSASTRAALGRALLVALLAACAGADAQSAADAGRRPLAAVAAERRPARPRPRGRRQRQPIRPASRSAATTRPSAASPPIASSMSASPATPVMSFGDFMRVKAVLDAKLGPEVQALALAWTRAVPGRVHVGHGGVRARLRSGVVLRRRLRHDQALALLQQRQQRAVHRPPHAAGDAARRHRRRRAPSG